METVLDKSWLNAPGTNIYKNVNNDLLVNSVEAFVEKQKSLIRNNDDTIEYLNDLSESPQKTDNSFSLPVILPPYLIFESKSYFTRAQRWIGHVTKIGKETFKAQLLDLNDPTTYEMGEFDLNEVPPEDLELLSVGAAFYWSIGQANINGQIEKKSLIRFQRMRPWSTNDYDAATDKANTLFNELNWE